METTKKVLRLFLLLTSLVCLKANYDGNHVINNKLLL